MGDAADDAVDYSLFYESARIDYATGQMADEEAYDLGLIDPLGFTIPRPKTCKCCGIGGLHWQQLNGKWRLFDSQGLHKCPKNPLIT